MGDHQTITSANANARSTAHVHVKVSVKKTVDATVFANAMFVSVIAALFAKTKYVK